MNRQKILDVLEVEGIIECDDISYNKKEYIINGYYTFDKVETEGARSYANENYKEVTDDTWFDQYYFPYLYDIARDNMEEVLEEIAEEENINYDWSLYEMDVKIRDKCEVLIVFSGENIDMEKIIDNLEK